MPKTNPIERFFVSTIQPPEPTTTRQEFIETDLRGARFQEADLSYAKLRGVNLVNAEIWGAIAGLVINGVEIAPLVEAELRRQHPGRDALWADDAEGARTSWAVVESMWEATFERARDLPEAALHERVDGEWSFLETQRHLVMGNNGFLAQVTGEARPVYRAGVPHTPAREAFTEILDLDADPSFDEVLAARSDAMREIRDFLAKADDAEMQRVARKHSHLDFSGFDMPVLWCLWRLVNEEVEHHSFAVRDLATLELTRTTR